MIIGIGNDMVDIRRIEKVLARHGERFINRIFTDREQATCARRKLCAPCYAKRFAAKEACAKALGTGMAQGVIWRDLQLVNLASGRPAMALAGEAAKILATMIPQGFSPQIHVSLTDDFPWAQAFVIIEAHSKREEQA